MKRILEQFNHDKLVDCVILAKKTKDNHGYGRIVLDSNNGTFIKIVEQKDCTEKEKQIELINTGVYGFKLNVLINSLKYLNQNNSQKEYYLTDCPKIIKNENSNESIKVIETDHNNYDETMGANTVEQLNVLRNEYNKKFVVQLIQDSGDNLKEYNLMNLTKVLGQLSVVDLTDLHQLSKTY